MSRKSKGSKNKRKEKNENQGAVVENGGRDGVAKKRVKTNNEDGNSSLKEQKIPPSCPVLVQKIVYDDNPNPPSIPLTPTLDDLLYPMSRKEFLEDYFRKKAVHITCCTNNNSKKENDGKIQKRHETIRVSELKKEMYELDSEAILRETSSDNIFVWLQSKNIFKEGGEEGKREKDDAKKSSISSNKNHGKTNTGVKDDENNKFIQSIEISDVETAVTLHKVAGHATYCRAPPKVEQSLVSSLLRATGLGCGQYDPSGESMISLGRGEVETFISTNVGTLTNWHYDFQENFTIQLSGIKRWTVQQGTIQDPIRGCTPHYLAPDAVESQLKAAHLFDRKFRFGHPKAGITAIGDTMSIDIKPGDVFYFPAGMWHKIEVIQPGVSINVSLMAQNYASVITHAMHQYLYTNKTFREPIINNQTKNVVDHLKGLLKELPTLIKGLENNGYGAENIIPPTLQYPPKFRMSIEEEEEDSSWKNVEQEDESSNDENEKSEDDDMKSGKHDSGEEEEVYDSDKGREENRLTVDDDEDSIIEPIEFDSYPEGWDLKNLKLGEKITIIRNPLAALHMMSETTQFYYNKNGNADNDKHQNKAYILNVNYSGNEMHQSAVRVVFKDDSKNNFIKKLYDWERNNNKEKDDFHTIDGDDASTNSSNARMGIIADESNIIQLKFLVYHGYLQIKK